MTDFEAAAEVCAPVRLHEGTKPLQDRQVIPTEAVEAANDDAERDQWIARMSEHVEKLGLQQAIHDYAEELRACDAR